MYDERNPWFRPSSKATYAEGSHMENYRQAYASLPIPDYVIGDAQRFYVPQSEEHLF